jgi:hypothetical protein
MALCLFRESLLLLGADPVRPPVTHRDPPAPPTGMGGVWRNRPGDVHTIEALEDSDVLEVSTPDLDDVVRLSDNYGRAGTSEP